MPSQERKRKVYLKKYRLEHKQKKDEYDKLYYLHNSEKIKFGARSLYQSKQKRKNALSKEYYHANQDKLKAAAHTLYHANPGKKKAAAKISYKAYPDKKKAAAKSLYYANPAKKIAAVLSLYHANPKKMKAVAKRLYYTKNPSDRLASFRKYHCCYRKKICHFKKIRYHLAQPKPILTEVHLRNIHANLLCDVEAKSQLIEVYKRSCGGRKVSSGLWKTVCRIAARKLVNKALQSRKTSAGDLLATIRSVKSISLKGRKDFGDGCHSVSTEPYFYEAAYQPVQRDSPIPVNRRGQCIVAEKISFFPKSGKWKTWKCTKGCRPISDSEVDAILCLKSAFELSIEELRAALTACDYGCPYGHYTKLVKSCPVDRIGHPIVCYCGSLCTSQLRILRAASTHFPILRHPFYMRYIVLFQVISVC